MSDIGPAIVAVIGTVTGGAIGAVSSYAISRRSQNHAERLARQTQEHERHESAETRRHERMVDQFRRGRNKTESVYPAIAGVIEQINGTLNERSNRALAGNLPVDSSGPGAGLEPETSSLWGEIRVFGSEPIVELWDEYVRLISELRLAIHAQGVALEQRNKQPMAPDQVAATSQILEEKRTAFLHKGFEIQKAMRRELRPDSA